MHRAAFMYLPRPRSCISRKGLVCGPGESPVKSTKTSTRFCTDNYIVMMFILLLTLVFACRAAVQLADNMALNDQSPFIRVVQSVRHRVESREIIIELHPARRCSRPEFRVRLSGTSLYIVDLQQVERNQQIYRYPPLIDPGAYFLEVIALLCGTFNPNNLVDICLEEVAEGRNVVTLPYTFYVNANQSHSATAEARPRWVLANKQQPAMLPTRYQKVGCKGENKQPHSWWCPAKPADVAQFDLYHWADGLDYKKSLHDVLQISRDDERNNATRSGKIYICQIGDSHANMLAVHGGKLNEKDVAFIHIDSQFPEQFDINWLQMHHCSYAILTYGQWPASFKTEGKPYNKTKYTQQMRRVLTLLQNYDHNQTQVFVRSVNYNGLGARQTACPPIDYRSPPVIDMFNSVLKNLTRELQIEFIDLNPIMGPMWDSAEDWCHPEGKIATAEVEMIFAHVLQSSLRRRIGVMLYKLILPERSLVRFTDSAMVYLLENEQLRAFLNGHTFYAMGFDFGNVQILDAKKRGEFLFGPDLPKI